MTLSPTLVVQLAVASAVGAGVIAACRWLRRRSPLCGRIVGAGVLVRAAIAVVLFWTSFLDVRPLRSLHSGDGFWKLAIDARLYYDGAVKAAHGGLATVARGSQSPAYVKVLAIWMRAVGVSPISGAYLNIVLFVLLCVLMALACRLTGQRRADLPCAVMLAALSFSPVLVLYGSQPLKDMLVVFLIGALCLAAQGLLPRLVRTGGESRPRVAGGLALGAVFLAALYVLAGIRAYFGVIAWSALAVVLLVFAARQRLTRLAGYAVVSGLFLTMAWQAYRTGADLDLINPYAPVIARVSAYLEPMAKPAAAPVAARGPAQAPAPAAPPPSVLTQIDGYRRGFVLTPGATNTRVRPRPGAASPTPSTAPAAAATVVADVSAIPGAATAAVTRGPGVADRLYALAVGLGLLLVPVSLLKALSIVDFAGGRGLLMVTDVDTIFIDVTACAMLAVLVRRRADLRGQLPYVWFASTLAVVTGLLLAYIVTNFGTLFRLRMMAAAPLWMLPLAVGTRVRPTEEDAVEALAERTRASFGYEWTYFHRWQDSAEVSFRDCFRTADLGSLREARVLDAGCGMGRHARQMAGHARQVVAVDFSRAIQQASANTRGIGNVECVQADLLRLPFADGTFDYVYCLGVLHHLANAETALRALVRALKPGGRLRVYLYWRRRGAAGALLRLVDGVRTVTTRMPFWLLRRLCWLLSVVLWLALILPYRALAAAGVAGTSRWPLFVYARYPFRVLYNDQFDRFSAPLERRYDPREVTALLESAGLRNVRIDACFGWIAEGTAAAESSACAE